MGAPHCVALCALLLAARPAGASWSFAAAGGAGNSCNDHCASLSLSCSDSEFQARYADIDTAVELKNLILRCGPAPSLPRRSAMPQAAAAPIAAAPPYS